MANTRNRKSQRKSNRRQNKKSQRKSNRKQNKKSQRKSNRKQTRQLRNKIGGYSNQPNSHQQEKKTNDDLIKDFKNKLRELKIENIGLERINEYFEKNKEKKNEILNMKDEINQGLGFNNPEKANIYTIQIEKFITDFIVNSNLSQVNTNNFKDEFDNVNEEKKMKSLINENKIDILLNLIKEEKDKEKKNLLLEKIIKIIDEIYYNETISHSINKIKLLEKLLNYKNNNNNNNNTQYNKLNNKIEKIKSDTKKKIGIALNSTKSDEIYNIITGENNQKKKEEYKKLQDIILKIEAQSFDPISNTYVPSSEYKNDEIDIIYQLQNILKE